MASARIQKKKQKSNAAARKKAAPAAKKASSAPDKKTPSAAAKAPVAASKPGMAFPIASMLIYLLMAAVLALKPQGLFPVRHG